MRRSGLPGGKHAHTNSQCSPALNLQMVQTSRGNVAVSFLKTHIIHTFVFLLTLIVQGRVFRHMNNNSLLSVTLPNKQE